MVRENGAAVCAGALASGVTGAGPDQLTAAVGWWGTALAVSQVIVIALSPWVGAIADFTARKKPFLLATALVCAIATAALALAGPGHVAWALVLVVAANVALALSENLCASFLPEISTPANVGRISGYGWSFGYFGGLLSLVLVGLIVLIVAMTIPTLA